MSVYADFSWLFPRYNDSDDIAYGEINSIVLRVTWPEHLILWSELACGSASD
jgi:hypothetical protein